MSEVKRIMDPWNPAWDGPRELLPLLLAGKLEQTCPTCGKTEPAGGRCSHCWINPGWEHWHRPERTEAQRQQTVRMANKAQENRSERHS